MGERVHPDPRIAGLRRSTDFYRDVPGFEQRRERVDAPARPRRQRAELYYDRP